jgi:GH25 family lysozyme M1 (1,4-beta-N-acetylmuramidase)
MRSWRKGFKHIRWIGFRQMLITVLALVVSSVGLWFAQAASASPALSGVQGIDVSVFNGAVNWSAVYRSGIRFAFIRASYATLHPDARFTSNWSGAAAAGVVRGAYQFALPNVSSGAAQARYFLVASGGRPKGTRVLPGALDLEPPPSGSPCYGLHQAQMRAWINDWIAAYRHVALRNPLIYTGRGWWNLCVGTWRPAHAELWVASWRHDRPTMPAGWGNDWTFWQYGKGKVTGVAGVVDRDRWAGTLQSLYAYADNR